MAGSSLLRRVLSPSPPPLRFGAEEQWSTIFVQEPVLTSSVKPEQWLQTGPFTLGRLPACATRRNTIFMKQHTKYLVFLSETYRHLGQYQPEVHCCG